MKRLRVIAGAALTGGMVALGSSAAAQAVDPQALVGALMSGQAGPVVKALDQQGALVVSANQPIPAAFDFPSVDVTVAFDGESHLLTTDGMTALRSVALALKDPRLDGESFQIGAHAGSAKNPTGIQRVSAQRAQVVVDHLVAFYGIPAARLTPVGYGAMEPRDALNPGSPLNSRIEITNLLAR